MIKIGNCYIARVSKSEMPIRIEAVDTKGGWQARSLTHGRIPGGLGGLLSQGSHRPVRADITAHGSSDSCSTFFVQFAFVNDFRKGEGVLLQDLAKPIPSHVLVAISPFQVLAPTTLHLVAEVTQ